MRISDQQPAPDSPQRSSEDVDSAEKTRKDEPSAFSRTLANKRASQQLNVPAKPKDAEVSPVPDIREAQNRFDSSMPAERLAGTTTIEIPPQLQQLVREISLVVNAPGNQQVHIELNSNVLKGLHIRIERQNGAIAIQFQSTSAEVSRLLSTNLNSLTQGLADRGVNVADVRVNSGQDLSSSPKYKQGADPDRGWQSGRQGQRG